MTGDRRRTHDAAGEEPSLDPRTWSRSSAKPGPATDGEPAASPAAAPHSFDPRTWLHRPASSGPSPSGGAGPNRRLLVFGGAGALAAVGGGTALWRLAHRDSVDPIRADGAADAAIAADGTSYTAPDVEGYAGLRERLANYQIPGDQIAAAVAALQTAAGADPGRMHLIIRIAGADGAKPKLVAAELRRTADGVGYLLSASGDGFAVTALPAALITRLVPHARAQVNRDGLYASAVGDLSADMMTQFAEALAFDFDIAEEVREGDQFEVVHQEQRDGRGNPVGDSRLMFAFLSAGGKDRYLYRFQPPGGEEGWYDDRGRSTKKAFMRTPLDGARITSLFGERVHPVFHDVRLHKGVDFGCGIGTHIFAAADGVVDYAGPASGFGVLLKLRHEGGLETWYGHLSGFPEGVGVGAAVKQGQLVALSGNVGFSTGPHLHYEVHKDGVAVDPKDYLDVQGAMSGAGQVLEGRVLASFMTFKDEIDVARRAQA